MASRLSILKRLKELEQSGGGAQEFTAYVADEIVGAEGAPESLPLGNAGINGGPNLTVTPTTEVLLATVEAEGMTEDDDPDQGIAIWLYEPTLLPNGSEALSFSSDSRWLPGANGTLRAPDATSAMPPALVIPVTPGVTYNFSMRYFSVFALPNTKTHIRKRRLTLR